MKYYNTHESQLPEKNPIRGWIRASANSMRCCRNKDSSKFLTEKWWHKVFSWSKYLFVHLTSMHKQHHFNLSDLIVFSCLILVSHSWLFSKIYLQCTGLTDFLRTTYFLIHFFFSVFSTDNEPRHIYTHQCLGCAPTVSHLTSSLQKMTMTSETQIPEITTLALSITKTI